MIIRLALLTTLKLGMLLADSQREECFVDMPLFDARGSRLSYNIIGVSSGEPPLDLLTASDPRIRVRPAGTRLYFPRYLIGRLPLVVTTKGNHGKSSHKIVLTWCAQRTSLRHGWQEVGGGDVGNSLVKGKLTGCVLSDEWWIRAAPMFGGPSDHMRVFEGFIDPKTKEFVMNAPIQGERYLIIVGRRKEPVEVLGVDLVHGAVNDLGKLDVSSGCPEAGSLK